MGIGGFFITIASVVTLLKVLKGSKSRFAITILVFSLAYGLILLLQFQAFKFGLDNKQYSH